MLPGATWQRCRTHAMKNLLTHVPKSAQAMVATLVRTVFAQSDVTQVKAQFARVVDQRSTSSLPPPASSSTPRPTCSPSRPSRSSTGSRSGRTTQERLNKELRRRTDVVGIFPNRPALIRLCGAVLAEQHDEWAVARRYMSADSLVKARLNVTGAITTDSKEVVPAELQAVS